MATLAELLRAQGGDWNIGGIDRAQELADLLGKQGVTSLDVRGFTGGGEAANPNYTPNPNPGEALRGGKPDPNWSKTIQVPRQLTIGGKNIGFAGNYNNDGSYGQHAGPGLQSSGNLGDINSYNRVGWSARGDGNVSYNVVTGPDGKLRIMPFWASSNETAKYAPVVGALGAFVGGGLLANAAGMGAAGSAGAAGGQTAAGGLGTTSGFGGVGTDAAVSGAGSLGGEVAGAAGGAATGFGGVGTDAAVSGLGAAASGVPSWLPEGLKGYWDFIKSNPKLIGALAGGLLGGVSGGGDGGGGSGSAKYTGPMPTITRGGWQANNDAGYKPMAVPQFGLLGGQGTPQANSGLARYMGLLGQ